MTSQIIHRTLLVFMLAGSVGSFAATANPLSEARMTPPGTMMAGVSALLDNLPLDFVANRGQWESAVRFAARKRGMAATFGDRDITLRLGTAAAPSLTL